MNFEDFIKKPEEIQAESPEITESEVDADNVEIDLEVHKAVVESLAADKAQQDVEIESLRETTTLLTKEKDELTKEIERLKLKLEEMKGQLANVGDILARNTELPLSNQISLLERNPEVNDRFEGETREHILEILKAAHHAAEQEGRLRRAQIIEAVLIANEPTGELEKRRAAIEKLFADNQYVINGQVINELDKFDIRYKDGENYLLAKEIIARTY